MVLALSKQATATRHYQKDKPFTNSQRPVKVFLMSSVLKWSEQITVEFVTKKSSFPRWRLIKLHHRFLRDISFGNLKK